MARHDLIKLEYELQHAYDSIKKENSPDNKEELFEAIYNLALAILEVKGRTQKRDDVIQDLDKKQVAYEYGVYLFERIMTGKFALPDLKGRDKFAWRSYIDLNIRHIIWTILQEGPKETSIEDILQALDNDLDRSASVISNNLICKDAENKFITKRILRENIKKFRNLLELFYSDEEIERYLKLIYILPKRKWVNSKLSRFINICKCIYKRTIPQEKVSIKTNSNVDSVVRSTLFLASILSSEEDNRLFVSLDLPNLYRLATLCGGDFIYIPTVESIERLVGLSYSIWKAIEEGRFDENYLNEYLYNTKKELGLAYKVAGSNKYLEKLLKFLSSGFSDEDKKSKSVIELLISSIESVGGLLDKAANQLNKAITRETSTRNLLETYKELSKAVEKLNESLLRIRKISVGGS